MDFEMSSAAAPARLPADPPAACEADDCDSRICLVPFARIRVRPSIRFGAWVEWLLDPLFSDRAPYVYQLQVGHTGSNYADDWQDVGLSAAGVSYLVDDTRRMFGIVQRTHYRVRLTTPDGQYFSDPQGCWGDLGFRDWRLYQARIRQWRVQLSRTPRGARGWLLKRRLVGERPPLGDGRVDRLTEEVVDAQHPTTVGTEFLGGYYEPIPCVWADLGELSRRSARDERRGTTNDPMRIPGVFLGVPQLDSYDVWVGPNDMRWEIHSIRATEELQDVPVVVEAELRLLPFSHPVYEIEIPAVLPTGAW